MSSKVEIPDKATFKIGEVARLLDLEAYVLRYWETEFDQLRPRKSRSGQRVYRPADIEQLARIRDLLYVEQYTIAGARRQLEAGQQPEATSPQASAALDKLTHKNTELAAELEQAHSELAKAQERERALLLHVEDTRQEHVSLSMQLEAVETQLAQALEQAQIQRDELAQRADLEAARTGVDEQWETITSQLGADMERMESDLERYKRQATTLSSERDALLSEREQLERRCEEYVSRLHSQHQGKGRLLELLRREAVGLHQMARAS